MDFHSMRFTFSILTLSLLCGCDGRGEGESRLNYRRAGDFFVSTPSVSPDGSAIAYDSGDTGNGDVYLASRDGSKITRLTRDPEREMHPVFSLNGNKIAFAKQEDGYQHVWLMDANGSNQLRFTKGRVIDYPLVFSTNGSNIFFSRTTWSGRALLPRVMLFRASLPIPNQSQPEWLGDFSAVSADGSTCAT